MKASLNSGSDEYDVLVVGAGPAGCMTAGLCAGKGQSVLLVEKAAFPRYKVCGCCLSQQAMHLLDGLQLRQTVLDLQARPLAAIQLAAGKRSLKVPLQGSFALSRAAFDNALAKWAVEQGSVFLHSVEAKVISPLTSNYINVQLSGGQSARHVRAKVVVAADGIGGVSLGGLADMKADVHPSARIGVGAVSVSAPAFFQTGIIYMAYGPSGYVGLVRLEDGTADIAAALNKDAVSQSVTPASAISQLWQRCGWPVPDDLHQLHFRGTAPLTRRRANIGLPRVFVVGDAASYVEPFTGEGIAWALESARQVVPFVTAAVTTWDDALTEAWRKTYESTVGKRQSKTKLITDLLRHPQAAAAALHTLVHVPRLAHKVADLVIGSPAQEDRKCLRS